ncbi:MAG: tryptophan-rich sensory protein [Candidatus Omnitrophica bacterium]|nr:tryptophan-rich sensory protein [Candidatus Omnitrophota bacterium]
MAINWPALLTAIFICQAAGLIGAKVTRPALKPWYRDLKKPLFTPPDWLFAPAWITLYLLMAVAVYLIWMQGLNTAGVKTAVVVFIIQLLLNSAWSFIFFGMKSPLYGLIEIVILWLSIAVCSVLFWQISILAGWLMVPYLLWVSFAAVLNFAIWKLNPSR